MQNLYYVQKMLTTIMDGTMDARTYTYTTAHPLKTFVSVVGHPFRNDGIYVGI